MVFYGKKKNESEENYQEYRSIKEEILKELGERITPVYQKSLATIFADAGHIILIATQTLLSIPEYLSNTTLYKAYQDDKKMFKVQMQSDVQLYESLPKSITDNKLYLIENFTCQQRMFALNASVFLMGLVSLSSRTGAGSRIRGLMKTCLVGYSMGGVFLVPEIYNTIFSSKVV